MKMRRLKYLLATLIVMTSVILLFCALLVIRRVMNAQKQKLINEQVRQKFYEASPVLRPLYVPEVLELEENEVIEWDEPELITKKPRKDKKGRRNKLKGKKNNTKTTTTKTETTTATPRVTQQAHAESTKLPSSNSTRELPTSSTTSNILLFTENLPTQSETISSFQNVTTLPYLATWEATAPSYSIELSTDSKTANSVESETIPELSELGTMSVQEAAVTSTYSPATSTLPTQEESKTTITTQESDNYNYALELDRKRTTMAPIITSKAVQTPALGLSTSETGDVEEVDYSWYDSDTKNIFYPQSPIECYMYEYYRENEEPLTIKECLFLYQKILRLRNNDSRKVNAVSEASVTTRISTEGALKITQTEPSTTTSIPAPKKGEISTSQISKFPISEKVTTQAPISSEFWTSEPFVIDDSGILDAFSETASSSNEDDSSVESAASTTANELATTTVAKTTTTQSDNYYDCLSKKYVSFDGIELTFEECQTLAEMIPRDLLPLYMKDATVDESLPPTADESLTTAHKAFILKLIGLPECSDAKVRQVSKHFARRKVKVLSAEKNCPNISVRLQLTSGATKKHVSHLLPRMLQKIFHETILFKLEQI